MFNPRDPSHPLPITSFPSFPSPLPQPGETDETKKFSTKVVPVMKTLARQDIDESMIGLNPLTGHKKCWGNFYLMTFPQYPSIIYFYVGYFPGLIVRSHINCYLKMKSSSYPGFYTYHVEALRETLKVHLDHSSIPSVPGDPLARVCTIEEASNIIAQVSYFLIPCSTMIKGPIMRLSIPKWGDGEGDLEEKNAQDVIDILETRLSQSVDITEGLKKEVTQLLALHQESLRTIEMDMESACTHWYWDFRKVMGTLELPWVQELSSKYPGITLRDVIGKLMNRVEKETYDAGLVKREAKLVAEEVRVISEELALLKKEIQVLDKEYERRIPDTPLPPGTGLSQVAGGHSFPEGEDLAFLQKLKLHSEHLRYSSTFVTMSDEFTNKILSKTFEEKDTAYINKANATMNKMIALMMQFEEDTSGDSWAGVPSAPPLPEGPSMQEATPSSSSSKCKEGQKKGRRCGKK